MIFHSLDFVAFFLITLALYWALPVRAQNVLLLAGGYVFYGWVHPWWVLLLVATTLVDYCAARGMTPSRIIARRSGPMLLRSCRPIPRKPCIGRKPERSERFIRSTAMVRVMMSARRSRS